MKVIYSLLILHFIFYQSVLSQGHLGLLSLSDYLPKLEEKFDIKFSYLEKYASLTVKDYSYDTKKACITKLERQLNLRIEELESDQFVIRKFKPSDLVSVCGLVVNNNFPIKNLGIESSTGNPKVTSDQSGYFSIENVAYGSELLIKDQGFLIKSLLVSQLYIENCPKIEVYLYQENLKEVVIENYLTKGITKKRQLINIKTNDFGVLPGISEPDVMKSLEHIPGVQSPFEMASKLYVRGSTPDQNLVLWNGVNIYNPSHFFGLISAFNPYVIDEINFYPKAINAKYKSRVGGLIDLKTSDEIINEFSGGGGANLINLDAFAKIPIIQDKLSISVSGRRSFNDVVKTPTYTSMSERVFQNFNSSDDSLESEDSFYFFDTSIGLNAKFTNKDYVQFNAIYASNNLDFSLQNETILQSNDWITKNEGYALKWQHRYLEKLTQNTEVTLSNYLMQYTSQTDNINQIEEADELKRNFINDLGVKSYIKFDYENFKSLEIGFHSALNNTRYSVENSTQSLNFTLDDHQNKLVTNSLFGEYNFDNDNSFLQLGFRINSYSVSNDLYMEPRLFAETEIFEGFKLNTSASITNQAITQIQESLVSSFTLETDLWRVTDNEEYKILESQHYSFGSSYTSKSWFLETDLYYKRTDNITSLTAGFLNPFDNNFHVGNTNTIGFEFFAKKKFTNYSTWVSYNFSNQQTRFDEINNGNYYTSNLNIDHTIKWQHYFQWNQFQFSLGWFWHSGRATTDVTYNKTEGQPVEVLYDELNTLNLPIYHKLDFSMLYNIKPKNKNLSYQLGLSIQNIYNRKSILNREYRLTPGIDNSLEVFDYYSLAFTPNISLRVFW